MSRPTLQTDPVGLLFEDVLAWLNESYDQFTFYVERDVVWTIQGELIRKIRERQMPLRIFNDFAVVKGPRRGLCADLAILDQSNKVKLAAEFKYEPDHRRTDILRQKLPVVGWKDMEKDISRIREFIEAGAIEAGYTVFIDEGGFFRRREAHLGSSWIDWPPSESRASTSILFSRLAFDSAKPTMI